MIITHNILVSLNSYHTFCISPSIETIPHGNWYCSTCQPIVFGERNSTPLSSTAVNENDSTFCLSISSRDEEVEQETAVLSSSDITVDESPKDLAANDSDNDNNAVAMLAHVSRRQARLESSSSSEISSMKKNPGNEQTRGSGLALDYSDTSSSSLSIISGSDSIDVSDASSSLGSEQRNLFSKNNNQSMKTRSKTVSSPLNTSIESIVSGEYDVELIGCNSRSQNENTSASGVHSRGKPGRGESIASNHRKRKKQKPKPKNSRKKPKLFSNEPSTSSFLLPSPRRARTAATPRFDRSFREAVIASHRCDRSVDGLREAQKILFKFRASPKKLLGTSSTGQNITIPHKLSPQLQGLGRSGLHSSKGMSNRQVHSNQGSRPPHSFLLQRPRLELTPLPPKSNLMRDNSRTQLPRPLSITPKNAALQRKGKERVSSATLIPKIPKAKKLNLSNISV